MPVPMLAGAGCSGSGPARAGGTRFGADRSEAAGQRSADDKVTINGQTKKWSELTPAEKAEVRRSIAQAREEISRINQGEIQREVREAMNETRINQEEIRREMAAAHVEVNEAMREIDAHAAEIRRAGQDPEMIKATVRASLKAVEAIDVQAISRQALASVDPATIDAALAAAEAGLEKRKRSSSASRKRQSATKTSARTFAYRRTH